MPNEKGSRRLVRHTLIWMFVAAVAMGGLLGFEHDSNAKGVMLEGSTLVKHDTDGNPCTDDHGHTKHDCVPCNNDPSKKCHPACQKGNGDPKNDCVPCTDKKGNPKDCKPCKGEDKNGNPKPKHCVMSGDQVTDEQGTVDD